MSKTVRMLTILFVLLVCVGCDQATKSVARETLAARPPITVLGGLLRLQYAENPGAFLSLGAGLPDAARRLIFVALAALALAAALAYVLRSASLPPAQWLGLSLALGGGLGNLIDRVLRCGLVVDFAIVSFGPLHTGIFNLADIALMAGIFLFVAGALRGST